MTTPPVFYNLDPYSGQTNVYTNTPISFSVIDEDSGVNFNTINVIINGTAAIINGISQDQDGYDVSAAIIPSGFRLIIYGSSFSEYQLCTVVLSAQDNDGNFQEFEYSFTTGQGTESVTQVQEAFIGPFNINVTVVFDSIMKQDAELVNPSNYIMSHGAYVTDVAASPVEADRVVLTVENLYGREWFGISVNSIIKDGYGNGLDPLHNDTIVYLESTSAAFSGATGRLKTNDSVVRLHEDSNYWYIGTTGGLDIIDKITLRNVGFILDGYGVNAISTDGEIVYFGCKGANRGVIQMPLAQLGGNNTNDTLLAFSIPAILSNDINDIICNNSSGTNLVAIATTNGVTVFIDGYSVYDGYDGYGGIHYSAGNDISSIKFSHDGTSMYLGNNTGGQIEAYYNVHTNTTSNLEPNVVYGTTTSPSISNSVINQIAVTNNGSVADYNSPILFVATDYGLTAIHTNESEPGLTEGSGISIVYGTQGSGLAYEILGGDSNRVVAVDLNIERLQVFVMTNDVYYNGGLTTINIRSHTVVEFRSYSLGTLISEEVTDITFKNL